MTTPYREADIRIAPPVEDYLDRYSANFLNDDTFDKFVRLEDSTDRLIGINEADAERHIGVSDEADRLLDGSIRAGLQDSTDRLIGINEADAERHIGIPNEADRLLDGDVQVGQQDAPPAGARKARRGSDASDKYLGYADDGLLDKYFGIMGEDGSDRYIGMVDDYSGDYMGIGGDGSDRYLGLVDDGTDKYLGYAEPEGGQTVGLADAAGMIGEEIRSRRGGAWYKDEHGNVDPKKLPPGVEYVPGINMFRYLTWDKNGNIRPRLAKRPPTKAQLDNMRRKETVDFDIKDLTTPTPSNYDASTEYWKNVSRRGTHPAGYPPVPTDPHYRYEPQPGGNVDIDIQGGDSKADGSEAQADGGEAETSTKPKDDVLGQWRKERNAGEEPPEGAADEKFDMDEWRRQKDESIAREHAEQPRAEPQGIGGGQTIARGVTDPNDTYDFRWRIVDMDTLRPSHNHITFERNENYDATLQPRDRERAASFTQIPIMASKLNADSLLEDSRSLEKGPPIIGSDMQVESGNARIMALMQAREQFPDNYAAYVAALKDPNRLQSMGFEPSQIEDIANPVLVREHDLTSDPGARRKFVVESNASNVAPLSAPEKALSNADAFRVPSLARIEPDTNKNLNDWLQSEAGNELVMDYLRSLDQNQALGMADAQGRLSKQGLDSIKYALFANVYGRYLDGDRLQQELTENVDEDIKRVGDALMDSLPSAAKAEAHARVGLDDADISIAGDIVAAVQQLRATRQRGMKLEDYLRSYSADKDLTPHQKKLLAHIGSNLKNGGNVRRFIEAYADKVLQQAPANQGSMMGGGEALAKEKNYRASPTRKFPRTTKRL